MDKLSSRVQLPSLILLYSGVISVTSTVGNESSVPKFHYASNLLADYNTG